MKRLLFLLAILSISCLRLPAQTLVDPFVFVMPTYDSTHASWLPQPATDTAGAHGFVKVGSDGHLAFEDGTSARFIGVTISNSACFPDSLGAIATAARLAKLGVNMVRFDYFDWSSSDGASILAPGTRSDTLSPSQMKRLDWFLHQLGRRGIYAHLVLKSRNAPRKDDGVPGWDSTYNYGQYIAFFSAPLQRMQRAVNTALFTHVNRYTGRRYADDPTIALVTIDDNYSPFSSWVADGLNQAKGVMSFAHSRMIDTLFADYLERKYGSTAGLRDAYFEGIRTPGPELLRNPGFESYMDNWTLTVGEGARASSVVVQGPDVPAGEGTNSLRVVVRQVNGTESRITLDQIAIPVKKYAIYQLRFKAKTDSAGGRSLRVQLFRGASPYDNFGLNDTVHLTTQWQTFTFTFRSSGTDSLATTLRIACGKMLGDLFLDGLSLTESGRDGLDRYESIDVANVARTKFSATSRLAIRRILDLVDFYDSTGRAYYRTMYDHLRSLGVRIPIAATNNTIGSPDTRGQSALDFTAETAQWDYSGTRQGYPTFTDSTWVIRNYSILRYRDQKIPELARTAVAGKPFVAEAYTHIYPNAHRSEMMIFLPAYASLQEWDGIYFQNYNDRLTDLTNRRWFVKDTASASKSMDLTGFMADPSICALLPQVSAIMRGHWIAPAQRTIRLAYDSADLQLFPMYYSSRGSFLLDGSFANVATLVSAVRIDSFNAARHHTADEYYFTLPTDDNIQSDTHEITLDITKGVISVNTPLAQGGSGALQSLSSLKTSNLGVSWIDGGAHTTYLWTTLDTAPLARAPRSLLTITTRAANSGASWQFGDSSLGKNWGLAPTMMESVKLGINFYTAADTVILHPLDSLGRESGRTIGAVRSTNGSWRVTLDLATEKTPWFGVEQHFGTSAVAGAASIAEPMIGEPRPTPATDEATVELALPNAAPVAYELYDQLGRSLGRVRAGMAPAGRSVLPLDLRSLETGGYYCRITVGAGTFVRRIVVRR